MVCMATPQVTHPYKTFAIIVPQAFRPGGCVVRWEKTPSVASQIEPASCSVRSQNGGTGAVVVVQMAGFVWERYRQSRQYNPRCFDQHCNWAVWLLEGQTQPRRLATAEFDFHIMGLLGAWFTSLVGHQISRREVPLPAILEAVSLVQSCAY